MATFYGYRTAFPATLRGGIPDGGYNNEGVGT